MDVSYLSRGRQPGGNTPLRSACMQPSNSLLPKQSVDIPQHDLSPVTGSVPLGETLSQRSQDHRSRLGSVTPTRGAPEQLLRLHSLQQAPSHVQVQSDYINTETISCDVVVGVGRKKSLHK